MSVWGSIAATLGPLVWRKRKQIRDEAAGLLRAFLANPANVVPDIDQLFEKAIIRASELVGHKLSVGEAKWIREELGRIGILRETARLRAEAFKLQAMLERNNLGGSSR